MRARRSERGAAIVEAAMVLPFVILLVLGVVDISRAFFEAAKVQEAAEEGAIYASLNPTLPDEAIDRAEETIQKPDFTGAITVTCSDGGDADTDPDDQVSVTVSYTYNMITPLISSLVGPTFDLSHTETARVLSDDACTPSP